MPHTTKQVKEHIQRMTALLQQEGEEASQLMYVTQEDLGALPCYDGETVIAIRAPQGRCALVWSRLVWNV